MENHDKARDDKGQHRARPLREANLADAAGERQHDADRRRDQAYAQIGRDDNAELDWIEAKRQGDGKKTGTTITLAKFESMNVPRTKRASC